MGDQADSGTNYVIALLVIFFSAVIIFSVCFTFDNVDKKENFGALQSLYSNDGIQDAYLTLENDPNNPYYQDPYAYWRGVTWDLPTRNIHAVVAYPYLYENHIDRYGRVWPYW